MFDEMENVISCAKEIKGAYEWNYQHALSRLEELKQQLETAEDSDKEWIINSIPHYEMLISMFDKVDNFLLKMVRDSIK